MSAPLAVLSVVLVVAGAILAGVGDATALRAVGMAVLGAGAVLAVAYVFLLVGRSEDRERGVR